MTNGPLRLAIGSYKPDSGAGCAMNVESWIAGEDPISDFPDHVEPMVASAVQMINDNLCAHTTSDDAGVSYLCADCSVAVLELASRTRNTRLRDWPDDERHRLCDQLNEDTRTLGLLVKRADLLAWGHLLIDQFELHVAACREPVGVAS